MEKLGARSLNAERIRKTIVAGARTVFLRDGYGANLDAIADEAGVARKTLFNIFGSKDGLFEAMLLESMGASMDLQAFDDDSDIEAVLTAFATQYAGIILSDESVAWHKLLNEVTPRFSGLIAQLVDRMTGQMVPPLAKYLAQRMEEGRLITRDPEFAAERFLVSVTGMERGRLTLGRAPRPAEHRARYVSEAVEAFVRGLAPS